MRPEVLGGLGGFGALVEVPLHGYRDRCMVSGTDGVGTKLRLAIETGRHDTVGIDLVAMCVNDVVVQGAEPLFFLDYFATGKLDVDVAATVIEGIAEGCLLGRLRAARRRDRRDAGHVRRRTTTTWPASAWAWSRRTGSSTARGRVPATRSSASPPRARTRTVFRSCAARSR